MIPKDKIVIIDYGLCNLNSVLNALKFLGANAIISQNPEDIASADKLILPGVGAFGEAMKNINDLGLKKVMDEEVLVKKKPILGICLGFQLFAKESEENGLFEGLGWIDSTVKKLNVGPEFRIPHVGWNNIKVTNESCLFEQIPDDNFYFVHSYGYIDTTMKIKTSVCSHGVDFVASFQKENIIGTQFHPEKSHASGLRVLKNFIEYRGETKC
ncbi:imidazole glycerol phosphate synthase subunit HisH [Candidatus Woesearchaeota archaeon]|jgi:imidazole glycerol-phosphate synthase subunit HisH|nr:imidazole glycerol phosphate synthase subunit HisH [Candidatus Woesearchaeota archaeon]MBT3538444.1 imidazole glycerol phosphate synthase subunit HisH [Candidatus Woesearchaeota archaeon]MBT4697007.1 imidazole glycerol phosphate synthase subunit HisH [Candidatus Woesearchaeota archaeon]MBT7106100.1 imidazole glycerol phosphate synthase subunit HisH [Candidatus Woesearchaeota archaeon]MBT7931002.1 imidazole glycerol phosphate synthase subunit HisH [Candidatus Woesearchaeota archaeon]